MNTFDRIDEAQTSLNNGITELLRDSSDDAQELKSRINRALVDLSTAQRTLLELTE